MSIGSAGRRFLLALILVALGASPALAQATIDPELKGVFSGLAVTGKANVIVTFHGESAPGAAEIAALKAAGIQGAGLFQSLPMAATLATWDQVQALAQDASVRSVFWDKQLEYYNSDATHMTGARRTWASQATGGLGVTGKGVRVVVNDTGIDGTHPDLTYKKKVIANVFGVTDRTTLDQENFKPVITVEDLAHTDATGGHGTHVAGTVAGTGAASSGQHAGVAPGADLIGYGSGAVLFILNALGGFDWALSNQGFYGIRAITNSWGSSGGFNPDNPINVASRIAAEKRNMVVLFAAGNSGSAPDTHNPYAKAPWVISVAAGQKNGKLAAFSSRGTPGGPKVATSSTGEKITWLDEPALTAPGVNIVSTRASTEGTSATGVYYTTKSGTSMATPVVAGIVALMLEANPLLTPAEVKQILRETATRMPEALPSRSYRTFETGAGYANAFAAVQKARNLATPFGKTLTVDGRLGRVESRPIFERTFDYSPLSLPGAYKHPFDVAAGTDRIEVEINFNGLELPAYGNAGNPLLLDVYDPNGNRYVGFDLFFALYGTKRLVVVVNNPTPGTWTAEVKALTPRGNEAGNFAAFPDTVHEKITAFFFDPPELNDIKNLEPGAKGAIEFALANGFIGTCSDKNFCPNQHIRRAELARAFTQFGLIRQFLPVNGGATFSDVTESERPFAEAVAARGAALRDREFRFGGVMEGNGSTFDPSGKVIRAELAKMFVRAVAGDAAALAHTGDVTYRHEGVDYVIADQDQIPQALRGYVHVAINANMLRVFASIEDGQLKFRVRPLRDVTRVDAAMAVSGYYTQYFR